MSGELKCQCGKPLSEADPCPLPRGRVCHWPVVVDPRPSFDPGRRPSEESLARARDIMARE